LDAAFANERATVEPEPEVDDLRQRDKSSHASSPTSSEWKVYLVLIIPITILLNLTFPNFHAPDDIDHLKRAYTLFDEPLRTITPAGRSTGAIIDEGLLDYADSQKPVAIERLDGFAHFERPLTAEHQLAYERKNFLHWRDKSRFSEMPGAISYFPLLYAPQAIAVEIGRASNATVSHTVFWARLANGFSAIALAAIGLYLMPSGRALALLLLLLPRTLLQFASNSADPILYGLALIILSLGIRVSAIDRSKSGILGLAIFIASSVRPPMACLALTPAIESLRQRRWLAFILVATACAGAALWFAEVLPSILDKRCQVSVPLSSRLENFSFNWPSLIGRSLMERGLYYYASLVGHYGWGDGLGGDLHFPLPLWIYGTALSMLGFAAWQDLTADAHVTAAIRLSLASGAMMATLLMFLAFYIACNAAGQTVIPGIQGRYFVPPLFALAASVGGLLAGRTRGPQPFYSFILSAWVIACATVIVLDASRLYRHIT
jgi:hypothetical protein